MAEMLGFKKDESMIVAEFRKQEAAYFDWLQQHPHGFVLNTRAALSPAYMKLHRASCKLMTGYLGKATDGGFTERQYRKVCSDHVPAIAAWVSQHGGELSTCYLCKPDRDELQALGDELYERAKKSMGNSVARKARLKVAPKFPATMTVTSTVFVRNPDVVAEVLLRANGFCEKCGAPAPFKRRDGSPFLEVHHLRPLSKGGEDSVDNAEAQCPNCHRECHFGLMGHES